MAKTKRGRTYDDDHLEMIRHLPCISCWNAYPSEAAHIRLPNTGMQVKPDDKQSLPLCSRCHRTGPGAEHHVGTKEFYRRLGINPIEIAAALYDYGKKGGHQAMSAYLVRLRFQLQPPSTETEDEHESWVA